MQNRHAGTAGGLEGVVVADTELSDVDGEAGRLVIRGHTVEQLAEVQPYETVVALLLDGVLPSDARLGEVRAALGEARVRAFDGIARLDAAWSHADGMDALRSAMSLGARSAEARSSDPLVRIAPLLGAAAVYVAAWSRTRAGLAPIAPAVGASHAGDFLRMASRSGETPPPSHTRALDAYLVTVVDHGMNASTFTARVVTSTGSDLVSAVVAAIGALKGPLHGGAPGPVLEMLERIGAAENATAFIDAELAAGRRIMGMGHRIYRVRDPRAAALERAIEKLATSAPASARLALARAVERAAERALAARHPDRPLRANVEFYTAVILDAVGLDRALFSPTFAVSRIAGWTCHALEQERTGRLIRPASRYVGPAAKVESNQTVAALSRDV